MLLTRFEQLTASLDKGLQTIYVVHGDDPLLVIEASDAIRVAVRKKGFSEREVLTAQPGFNWSELLAAAGTLSLFGAQKLLDVRIPSGKPGKEGASALLSYCDFANSDCVLLVTLPELEWAEEKAAWYKALVDHGCVVKLSAPGLSDLPGWIGARLRRQGQSADNDALLFMAERVEGNLLAAHQEILKLGLLYSNKTLTLHEVEAAVLSVARYDLDGLRDALLQGDVQRFARTLDGLVQEGEAPPLVLWAMTEEIRALAVVLSGLAGGRPMDQLLKEARVWGTRQAAFRKALSRLRLPVVEQSLKTLSHLDRVTKGAAEGDLWNELRLISMALAGASPQAIR